MTNHLSRVSGLALAGALAITATACTEQEREYAVPDSLCGVPVTKDALAPLLPSGKELREQKDPPKATRDGCKLFVDDQLVLFVRIWQVNEYPDPMGPKEHVPPVNRKEIEGLPSGQRGALGDERAMISATCAAPDRNIVLEVSVSESFTKDVEKRREDIERFTKSFTNDIKKKLKCTE
ncbi:hypothetical protein ACFUJR_21470 [Streptomyces sp. NPDC057271]|uniref:hypothetical protein n=1 Tax=unclassified Streptomyces TaxID=2593676 RepID=UPI00363A274E